MTSNPTGFKITDTSAGWNCTDFEDIFIRKDCFLEGGLWMWGLGVTGRLGDGTTLDKSSPVQTVSGGTNWRSTSIGTFNSAAIKTDGTLWLWGSAGGGRLGNNDNITSTSSPIQTISGGNNWRSVSLSGSNSAAIKTDGTLWLWGLNTCGALGTNDTISRSSPVQTISGGTSWRSTSLGSNHSAAIKTDGTLWLWGIGNNGRIGDNTIDSKSSPVQTVSGGNNWESVSLGGAHSAAIKTDGTLWLWGLGSSGRLGTNGIATRSSPVQTVSGGTNWKSVSLGNAHSAAIKTDGTLWLWGYGNQGQLGNTNSSRSSPIQTVSGGNNWRNISVGGNSTAAIKTDGTLWLWGSGSAGVLGTNNRIYRSSPIQTVSGGTNWRNVSLYLHTAAIREDCW